MRQLLGFEMVEQPHLANEDGLQWGHLGKGE
jgi:hypothetical protein